MCIKFPILINSINLISCTYSHDSKHQRRHIRPIECPVCAHVRFAENKELYRHIWVHHKNYGIINSIPCNRYGQHPFGKPNVDKTHTNKVEISVVHNYGQSRPPLTRNSDPSSRQTISGKDDVLDYINSDESAATMRLITQQRLLATA